MAVFLSRCIARADQNALACWLPMGGVLLLTPASPLPDSQGSDCAVRNLSATRSAAASAWRHWRLGLPFPDARSSERGTYTLVRRRANEEVEARFA
jgi:hypothetical protein